MKQPAESVSSRRNSSDSSTRSLEGAAVGLLPAITRLFEYCRSREWAGYDPYDALNSRLFDTLGLLKLKVSRLVLIQGLKRCPVNLRPIFGVPAVQNAKGIALFLSAALKLDGRGVVDTSGLARSLVDRLVELRSRENSHFCWGYSFPWQTRTVLVPRARANLVCTTFVANSLLDAYEAGVDSRCLDMALSAGEYIVKDLYWADASGAGFSYPLRSVRVPVHNANFLTAALLCRIARLKGEDRFLEPALRVARYSASRQREDGSWLYGEAQTQRWIDNFHTGYNLCALHALGRDLGSSEFDGCVRLGFDFYRSRFFAPDGAPRYFHDRTFPVDTHAVAQSIITLVTLRHLHEGNLQLAHSVLAWTMRNLWDQEGFFYYQKRRFLTVKIPYMRWSLAWMLLALAQLAVAGQGDKTIDPHPAANLLD